MSQEEAHRRPAADRERVTTEPPAAGRSTHSADEPLPPLFSARTDRTTGVVRARGHLDRLGAEALCRIVTALEEVGHRRIVVRLGSTTVAGDAQALLAEHARAVRTEGVRLLLR